MINKPTTIINSGPYLAGLRDNYKLDVKLIAQKKHPKVYLLSREEINLTLSSIDTSTPEGWDCAMATLKALYWKNYSGYMGSLHKLPCDVWAIPLFASNKSLYEMLTDRANAVILSDIEEHRYDVEQTVDPKEIDDDVEYIGGVRRNGFGDWVCSLFGHNPEAISKGSKGS